MNSSKTEKQPAKSKESKKKSVLSSSSSAVPGAVSVANMLSATESSNNTGTIVSTPIENKKKYTRMSNLNEANSDAVSQTVSMLQTPKENSKTDKKVIYIHINI